MSSAPSASFKPKRRPVVLIVRDGWGYRPTLPDRVLQEGNAVLLAHTPIDEMLRTKYPHALLTTSGEAVGLPPGQMGNSEVGHLNLGAGRIVYQDLTRISLSITDGTFFDRPAFLELIARVKKSGGRLHVMGLCSDGGVHSHLEHLYAVLELAKRHQLSQVFIHCFMDGRDTSPTGGVEYLSELKERAAQIGVGTIATVIGRYYAMDRDRRWERTALAYRALVDGQGVLSDDPVEALKGWYAQDKTDEFIPPTIICNPGVDRKDQCIRDGDGVLFFNFRSDRARQITRALMLSDFDGFDRGKRPKIDYVCMTVYDETFDLPVAFPPQSMHKLFCHVLADHGLKQLRTAETEKYAHVTFFFNGGVEEPVVGEDRVMIPSPKVATYDLQPEMSAVELTDSLITRLSTGQYDAVIINYANPDMVGHTGDIPAATKAVETVDTCVGRVLAKLSEVGGYALITADHGNAEKMRDEDGKPFTAHTTFVVPIYYFGPDADRYELRSGILADVSPTLLDLLGLPIPAEMTGKSLLVAKS